MYKVYPGCNLHKKKNGHNLLRLIIKNTFPIIDAISTIRGSGSF